MKKAMLWAASILMLAASMSWADPFVNPPCANWPTQWQLPTGQTIYNPWMTAFPYQRNIRYTFDNGLNPWQVTYQGTDDPVLWTSDVVDAGLAWTWFVDDAAFQPGGGAKRFGLIGIDNRQGAAAVVTGVNFHIDNWDSPNEWKHVWKEIVVFPGPGVDENETLTVPSGFEVFDPRLVIDDPLGDGWYVIDEAWKVWPNPPWEMMTIVVQVPAGSFLLIDEIHFATECVPEPATLSLAALGIGALLLRRRKK